MFFTIYLEPVRIQQDFIKNFVLKKINKKSFQNNKINKNNKNLKSSRTNQPKKLN